MKDPAFPFYAQDFLTGVMHFSMAERGLFITLLSYQWSHGKIPKERLGLILGSGWEVHWVAVGDKFTEHGNGFLINQRLEDERTKRAIFKQKQAENGKKGGRKPKTDYDINPNESQSITQIQNQKKPLENESENEKENVIEFENGKEGSGEKPNNATTSPFTLSAPGSPLLRRGVGGEAVISPFASAEFDTQWQAWKRYRATEHNFTYRSAESEQAALAELGLLAHHTETTAIAILHQSMGKGWKGFFELKNDATKPAAGKGKVRYSDDFKRKIAQRLQSK
jgi:uncharacterized protein YdaU (DUF1376 family)